MGAASRCVLASYSLQRASALAAAGAASAAIDEAAEAVLRVLDEARAALAGVGESGGEPAAIARLERYTDGLVNEAVALASDRLLSELQAQLAQGRIAAT